MTRAEKVSKFNRAVLAWYRKHGRDLPWRRTTDPYEILVSEIMLQQTQVDRVCTKYEQFISAFPTTRALTRASTREVLTLWSGLGYNRRALYLQRTAENIESLHNGTFPLLREELLRLPGIGMSTASAVRSFAFGEDDPMIDTNVRRILRRVFFSKKEISDTELYKFALEIIPKEKGREWNYAVMDIAALHCKAHSHSAECPLAQLHGKNPVIISKKPQKKFVGSDRYYRGAILRLVTEKGETTIIRVAKAFDAEPKKIKVIAKKMCYEGLVMLKNGRMTFPNKRRNV